VHYIEEGIEPRGCKYTHRYLPALVDSMKVIAVLALSLAQLALCQRPPFVLEYNCTTDGIPSVVIVAGKGKGQPSIEFFMPMFDDCSTAEKRTPAQFAAGKINPPWHFSCT
jgi:hypothetical protein